MCRLQYFTTISLCFQLLCQWANKAPVTSTVKVSGTWKQDERGCDETYAAETMDITGAPDRDTDTWPRRLRHVLPADTRWPSHHSFHLHLVSLCCVTYRLPEPACHCKGLGGTEDSHKPLKRDRNKLLWSLNYYTESYAEQSRDSSESTFKSSYVKRHIIKTFDLAKRGEAELVYSVNYCEFICNSSMCGDAR